MFGADSLKRRKRIETRVYAEASLLEYVKIISNIPGIHRQFRIDLFYSANKLLYMHMHIYLSLCLIFINNLNNLAEDAFLSC